MKDTVNYFSMVLTFVVIWIVVPGIMLAVSFLASSIVDRMSDGDNKTSARAGWWAGLVLFVLYFIYELPSLEVPNFKIDKSSTTLSVGGAIIGALIGYFLLLALTRLISSRVVGFITLLLTFSSASAVYSYFFIRSFNDLLISSTLGIALGVLVHIIILPRTVQTILPTKISEHP